MINRKLLKRIKAEISAVLIEILEQEMDRVNNLPTNTEAQADKTRCAAWDIIDTIESDYVDDMLTRKQVKLFYDFANKEQKHWEKIAKRRT